MTEISAEAPATPAPDPGPPPALYARWYRADDATATDGEVASAWRMAFPADRRLWAELTAVHDGITALAARLDASAAVTRPSRKSDTESEVAIALRKLLEGVRGD